METFEVRDSRDGFLWLSNSFFDNYIQHIQPTSIVIYLAIARMVNNQTQTCFPSYERLSDMTGMARSTVAIAIQELRDIGVLAWEKGGRKNVYRLLNTTSPKNGLFPKPVRSGGSTSPKNGHDQSDPSDPNKTHNKTKEQYFSSPSVQSENDLVLKSDETASTHPKRKQTPPSDLRHTPFREKLEKFWVYLNPDVESFAWGAGEAGQLAEFLRKWPKLTLKDFHFWLVNYSDSEDITPSKTPKQFLPFLHEYANGPRNEFHRPKDGHAQA